MIIKKKLLALSLLFVLFVNSFVAPFAVIAQEATPEPTQTTENVEQSTATASPVAATPLESSEPTSTPESTVTPASSTKPASTPEPTVAPTPKPTMSPDEYDVWKEQKRKEDDAQEEREDIWEANEENDAWIQAHGGNEEYYTSGAWELDQKAAAELKAKQEAEARALATPNPFSANETTGGSTSCVDSVPSSEPSVTNNNCAQISNNSNASGTSGSNNVSSNDGNVAIQTGTSSADGLIENNANTNLTEGTTANFASVTNNSDTNTLNEGNSEEELNSEENSTEFTNTTNSYALTVDNNNTAQVDNTMTVEGTSGSNTASQNDGSVTLTTGDVELIANMLNLLNLNVTGEDFLHLIVNIFGQLNGTLDLDDIALALGYEDDDALEVIARGSENSTETNTKSLDVENTNNAVVNNELNVKGVSGQNEVTDNDGSVDVITGRIQIMANILNFINSNFSGDKWKFIMINIFGNLNGNIIVPGTNDYLSSTGAVAASNNETTNTSDQTTIGNTNNVDLTNTVNANGVTGENIQNGNDDGDGAHTTNSGNTDIAVNILNFLNLNLSGNNFVFLIVNVFGKWMGQIVGFGDYANTSAPANGTLAALAVGQDGTSTTTNSTDTSVNNTNTATVNNEINVDGISGQNNVSGNDSQTSITTGWVEIDANLLNIINTNITGRSWMVVFLNVFGDFFGNLFFGKEAANKFAQQNAPKGVGGVETQNTHTTSQNQNTNETTTTQNSDTTFVASVTTTNTKSKVMGFAENGSEEIEEVESYVGQTFPEVSNDESQSDQQANLITQIIEFFDTLINKIRGVVYPIFASIKNIDLLSKLFNTSA